jgi:hypothetical protein
MKNFKHIYLMSIMLCGSSAFGMNYLKPALCGGLAGGALALCARYKSIPSQMLSNKIHKAAGFLLDSLKNQEKHDFDLYREYFSYVGNHTDRYLSKCFVRQESDSDWFEQVKQVCEVSSPAKAKIVQRQQSTYYCVKELKPLDWLSENDVMGYNMELTLPGMNSIRDYAVLKAGESQFINEMLLLSDKNRARAFIFDSCKSVAEGYGLWTKHLDENKASVSNSWTDISDLRAFLSYGKSSTAKGFAVGALGCMALKYALAK